MWTIPSFKVKDALALKAQQMRARATLNRAIRAVGGDHAIETAIRSAVMEAELLCVRLSHGTKNAVSGARVPA
jgi:hypothetical protein